MLPGCGCPSRELDSSLTGRVLSGPRTWNRHLSEVRLCSWDFKKPNKNDHVGNQVCPSTCARNDPAGDLIYVTSFDPSEPYEVRAVSICFPDEVMSHTGGNIML